MGAAGVLGVFSFFWVALFGSLAGLEALGSFFDLEGFDVCFGRSGSTVSVSMITMDGYLEGSKRRVWIEGVMEHL